MPFTTTATPPAGNAKVNIHFAGLLMLKPGADNCCEIGIHRFSNSHFFQIILVVNKPDRPPTLIRLVSGPLLRPFAISVRPNSGTGVEVFAPTDEPFERDSPANDVRDYRWALNLRSLHPGADFNDGARPIATLNAGVLYTPNLIPSDLEPELVMGTTRFPLHRMAADLAAAIDLPENGRVELVWDEMGKREDLTLPRPADPDGTTYTISFLNNPPLRHPEEHDEMYLYYRVLEVGRAPIPKSRRRSLTFINEDPTTDEIPCSPVVLHP